MKFTFLDRLIPGRRANRMLHAEQRQRRIERKHFVNQVGAITAGQAGRGTWMGMPSDEDAANKEYATDRAAIMRRSQDLDVNNPDIGGFHRARVAQIVGAGVSFRHCPIAEEIGLTEDQAVELAEQVDRLRKKHSENGGFDSQKGQEWEGTRQQQALLTTLVCGRCLIHRVWRQASNGLLPLSIELIPGSRITTPNEKKGDPLVSYGVRYSDERRTRIVGFYVRRVSASRGDSFIPQYTWDLLPAEDCALLDLTETAGIDQPLPLCTRTMRMLRNRGEFYESMVEAARAQSAHYAVIECAQGDDPYLRAMDDAGQNRESSWGTGVNELGTGVRAVYALNGEKWTWSTAHLPEPQLADFLDKTDERISRGLCASKSRFTRVVNNSFAGGRLEDQQDDPIIDQYRLLLRAAWHKVNGWFLEAIWLTGAIKLPGYSYANAHLWNEFHAEFPGKADITPVDTSSASEKNLMLRKTAPQWEIEKTGKNPRALLRAWAQWMKMTLEEAKRAGLPEGSLDILFAGKAVTTQAGQEIAPPDPTTETDDAGSATPPAKNPARKARTKNRVNGVFRS